MRQDPTFKHIFAHRFMVEELLRWCVGDLHDGRELVESLDFARLERVQEQSTTGPATDKRRYANDIVWRAPFRDGTRAASVWRHLVVMLEVQGAPDRLMALRMRNYVDNHHLELWRDRYFGATERLAPVLPVVFYTDVPRWTAAGRVIDLVTPRTTDAPEAAPELRSRRSAVFAGDGYVLLDTLRLAPDDLPHDNAAALLAGLCNPALDRLPGQLAALWARLDAPPLRELREVILRWAQHTARRLIGIDLGVDDMVEVDRLHVSGELEAYFAKRRLAYQQRYRNEGREQGVADERALLQRQASRKFGAGADGRLAPLLADIGTAEVLATVGEWIIDCETLEELVARLDGLAS